MACNVADLSDIRARLKPTTTVVRPHPCIAAGVQEFGRNFLGNPEASKELTESAEETADAARAAAELIRSASCVVVHTGAGIATNAGVGDFRGVNGVWTQLAKGIIPDDSFDITACTPSFAHMAVKALVNAGIASDVISTNHDGLHMKSGLCVGQNLHELHGNVYVERCVRCYKEFQHKFPVLRTDDRYTGRDCECGGQLWDSGIDFGQTLPQGQLFAAQAAAKKADVHLVLGSSLQVAPSSLLPRQYGGKLILVTKSATPADKAAAGSSGSVSVRSHGDIDEFMRILVDALGVLPAKSPRLEDSGLVSISMLLKRRWALRAVRVLALAEGKPRQIDSSVPPGWSRHVDEESASVDYWFHTPSNKISFGRPTEDSERENDAKGSAMSPREARARQAEKAFSAAAPSIAEVRAWAAQQSKGSPPGPPPKKGEGKGKINHGQNASSTPPHRFKGSPPGPPPAKGKGKTSSECGPASVPSGASNDS